MPTRLSALDRIPVRNHWPEITRRAADLEVADLVPADAPPARRNRVPALAAVAVAIALVGAGFLIGRSMPPTRVATSPSPRLWTVGPSISVAAPDRVGVPLVSAAAGHVVAAFRGGSEIVFADERGAHRSVAVAGTVAALGAGVDRSGKPIGIVLTRAGLMLRVGGDGVPHAVADLGPVASRVEIAVADGRVFVARAGFALTAFDVAGSGAPVTVGTVHASLVVSSGDDVWAIDTDGGVLERIGASSLRVEGTVRIRGVVAMAALPKRVYVAQPAGRQVSAVDDDLVVRDIALLDPLTTTISAGDTIVWSAAFGVLRANDIETGRLVSTIARSTPQLVLAFDGTSAWTFGDFDGLRRLEQVP